MPNSRPLVRLLRLASPYWSWMAAGVLVSTVATLANIGLLALSGWFITAMGIAGLGGVSINYFTPAAAIRGLAMTRSVGRYLDRLISHEATFRLIAELRVWFYDRLEPLAPARLMRLRSGDLLGRMVGDIDTLDGLYLRILLPASVALVGAIITVVVAAHYSSAAAVLLAIGLAIAGMALPLLSQHWGHPVGERLVQSRAELRVQVLDGVHGLAELLIYGRADEQRQRLDDCSERIQRDQRRHAGLQGIAVAGSGLITQLTLWGVLLITLPQVGAGDSALSAALFALLLFLTLAAFELVAPLPQAFQRLGEMRRAAVRLFELADDTPVVSMATTASAPIPERPDLQIEQLRFRYEEQSPWVLNGLDLELPIGRRIGIVGATGSGKSTLIQLLLRFWDYSDGSIRLGESELRALDPEQVRRRFGVVSQQTHLFSTTLRENLLLARPTASDEELERACRQAQLHEFISQLPEGYATHLGEQGLGLSGGQARRLAIARALLKEAPILLLDEPLEGLDPATQQALFDDLKAAMAGRSVLYISHQLTGMALMDEVLVLERGQIIARGGHNELLERNPLYQRFQQLEPERHQL